MHVEWLEDILALSDSATLTEAAHKRHVTQPAFSRRIRAIETWLGCQILDRQSRTARLRPEVSNQIGNIQRLVQDLYGVCNEILGAKAFDGEIQIAAQHSLAMSFVPNLLTSLNTGFPKLKVRFRAGNKYDCLTMLITRQVDNVICYETPADEVQMAENIFERTNIGTDTLIPVCASDRFEEMVSCIESGGRLPMITYPAEVYFGKLIRDSIFPGLSSSHSTHGSCQIAFTAGALAMVRAKIGIAWLPKSMTSEDMDSGDVRSLAKYLVSIPLLITAMRRCEAHTELSTRIWEHLCATDNPADLDTLP